MCWAQGAFLRRGSRSTTLSPRDREDSPDSAVCSRSNPERIIQSTSPEAAAPGLQGGLGTLRVSYSRPLVCQQTKECQRCGPLPAPGLNVPHVDNGAGGCLATGTLGHSAVPGKTVPLLFTRMSAWNRVCQPSLKCRWSDEQKENKHSSSQISFHIYTGAGEGQSSAWGGWRWAPASFQQVPP